jgi:hypothetical protein
LTDPGAIVGIGRSNAMDLFYVGLVAAFFGVTWALVRLCERL